MKGRTWDITTLDALNKLVAELVEELKARHNTSVATVFALHGDLGAGKTTFVQTLAMALGIKDPVTSPTFVIMKKYSLDSDVPFKTLVHVDAYRLDSSEELSVLGFAEEVALEDNLICVEWPARVADLLPEGARQFHFSLEDNRRMVRET